MKGNEVQSRITVNENLMSVDEKGTMKSKGKSDKKVEG